MVHTYALILTLVGKWDSGYFFTNSFSHPDMIQTQCSKEKACLREQLKFASHRVARHHVTKVVIYPYSVAWCRRTRRDTTFIVHVNRPKNLLCIAQQEVVPYNSLGHHVVKLRQSKGTFR
jgi:hypothetical protein